MTFADRTILVGLVALAIPVVVHLLGRRRPRRVALPTTRFAEGAHAASRGRLWLKRLGLLALRLAAVALVVLALAGPHVGGGSAPAGRWALVLDASPSMRTADAAGVSAFERSRTRLARLLGALEEEAEVTLALSDGRGAKGSPAEARRALAAMTEPGWEADPLGPVIREALAPPGEAAARETAEGRPARLVLATDATSAALAGLAPGAFAEADVDVTILATSPAEANAWLGPPRVTVVTEDGRPVVCVEAEVRTTDPKTDILHPSLAINGTHHRGKGFRGSGRVRFRAPRPDEGPWQGEIHIGAGPAWGWSSSPSAKNPIPLTGRVDVVSIDNVRYFTASAPQAVHVLIVDAAKEPDARVRSADLVAAVFAGETDAPKHVTRRAVGEVKRTDTASADVVVWVGSAGPPAGMSPSARRAAFVWIPADPEPPPPALAEAVGLTGAEVEATPDGATIDPAGYTSDLLAAFEGGTSGDLAAAVFRRRLRWAGPGTRAGGSPAVAARFRDGAPAILDRRDAQGRVVGLTVGPAPAWGDLASRPEWVVLAHSLVEALAPAGGVRTLNLTVAEAAGAGLPAFHGEPGNYHDTDAQGRAVWYSVNVAPAETADLKADLAGLRSAFAQGRCRVLGEWKDPLTAIPGPWGGRGRDLTPLVVLALAAVLAAEGLLAWWASPRP